MKKLIAALTTTVVAVAITLAGVSAPAIAADTSAPDTSASGTSTAATTTTQASYPTSTPSSYPTSSPSPSPTPSLPCIPDYRVSYTYDSATNKGVISVPTDSDTSGLLCQSFYVTAASWTYTQNAVWPQNRNVVDALAKITASGDYSYAAAVTCGQGDVYASFSASPSPTPTLTAPGVPFVEHFLSDMGFKGVSPTYVQQATSCWQPKVVTGSASFTNVTCTPYSANQVTLPAVPGGVWSWSKGAATGSYAIGTGFTGAPQSGNGAYTYTLADGDSHDGYTVTPYSTTWTPTNASNLDCRITVIPGDPIVTPVVCTDGASTGGSITVDLQTGLNYTLTGPDGANVPLINGHAVGLPAGDYVVSVTTEQGYVLGGTIAWPLTVKVDSAANDCTPTLPVVDAGAVGTAAVCDAQDNAFGTITLTRTDGQTVDYTLEQDGVAGVTDLGTAQTSVSVVPGTYHVTAIPLPGEGLNTLSLPVGAVSNPDGSATMTIVITAPQTACGDIPTLAAFTADASGSPALCSPADGTTGIITLATFAGDVDYTITNDATHVTTDLGTTTSSLHVLPGSYTVSASVVHAGDTLLNFGAPSGSFAPIVIAAGLVACSGISTLAFTGVDPQGGIVLGAILLMLGFGALVVVRRRRVNTGK
jgi:hypothetical protein